MADNSRTIKSTKNVIINLVLQASQLIVNFIGRTIFIKILGVEYLGINGLFTNILALLSLTELGFGNAIIYSMYKPLAENNKEKLAALMNFYKKIYRKIAIAIFIIGIALVPFLDNIISMNDLSIGIDKIRVYYILFLINSVVSYLFVFKTTIISADQKMYIIKKYSFIALCIQTVVQVLVLLVTHNFILYLIIQILGTLGTNMYGAYKAKKMYPYIDNDCELQKKEKSDIYSNVSSIFIYKISGTILSNTDNILISMLVSTLLVGYYSNYTMIINAMLGIITMIFNSVSASIGNLNAEANELKKRQIFEEMSLISFIVMGVTSLCLINGLNDFINIWVGEIYVLDYSVLAVIVINYYIYGILNPVCIYRDATGIFKDSKNISIFLSVLNIVLSIVLGKLMGIFGILAATAISKILTTFWFQPYVLYKKVFESSIKKYYWNQLRNIIILVISYFLMLPIMNIFKEINIINLIIKMIITFVLSTTIIFLLSIKDEEMKRLLERIKMVIKNIKQSRNKRN